MVQPLHPVPLRQVARRWFLSAAIVLCSLVSRAQTGSVTIQLPSLNELPTPPARIPIFYPPTAPAPGDGIDRIAPLQRAGFDAPADLAPYVGEPFYAQLGTCFGEKLLTRKRRARLAEYRQQRDVFVEALRRAFARGAPPPPDASPEAAQAVEAAAQELRQLLTMDTHGWGYYRNWTVSSRPSEITPEQQRIREFQMLRAAVFYLPVLLPSQRRLLEDYVALLGQSPADEDAPAPPVVEPGAAIAFLPEGSRLRIPDTLPRALHDDLVRFARARYELQRDLARTLIALDGARSRQRRQAFEALAQRQQPAFAQLEADAEAIRTALSTLPPARPPAPPPAIRALINQLAAARANSQGNLIARLRATRERVCRYEAGSEQLYWDSNFRSGAQITVSSGFRPPDLNLAAVVNQTPIQANRASTQQTALQATFDDFLKATRSRLSAIEELQSTVVREALRWQHPEHPSGEPYPHADVVATIRFLQSVERSDRLPAYTGYFDAMLRPGLAPEQRRLLFAAAVRDLRPPLPPGVRRPAGRFESP